MISGKLVKFEPTAEGVTVIIKVPDSQIAEVVALYKKDVEVFESGRIITIDEQASEKFAAIFRELDSVVERFREKPAPEKPLFEEPTI